jgi:hypothetical protein
LLIKGKECARYGLIGFERINGNGGFGTIVSGLDQFVDVLGLCIYTQKYRFDLRIGINGNQLDILDFSASHVL